IPNAEVRRALRAEEREDRHPIDGHPAPQTTTGSGYAHHCLPTHSRTGNASRFSMPATAKLSLGNASLSFDVGNAMESLPAARTRFGGGMSVPLVTSKPKLWDGPRIPA